eukprot:7314-Heterococcus_DN1.PRE.3
MALLTSTYAVPICVCSAPTPHSVCDNTKADGQYAAAMFTFAMLCTDSVQPFVSSCISLLNQQIAAYLTPVQCFTSSHSVQHIQEVSSSISVYSTCSSSPQSQCKQRHVHMQTQCSTTQGCPRRNNIWPDAAVLSRSAITMPLAVTSDC